MINLTELMRQGFDGPAGRLVGHLLPEMYLCHSLREFIEDLPDMPATNSWIPPACFFNGDFLVYFPNLICKADKMPNKVLLYDLACEVEAQIPKGLARKASGIHRRIHNILVSYNTQNKILTLRDFRLQGPPSPDRARDKVHLYAEPEVSPYTI
jgi:hypothetical protein